MEKKGNLYSNVFGKGRIRREQNTSPDFIVFMANGNYNCTFIYFFSVLNITAVNPVTGEVIEAYNLLSVKGFVKMLVTAQGNFTGSQRSGDGISLYDGRKPV